MSAGVIDPEFLVGASLSADRFKVVARIGAGSMAIVYRAFDHSLETEVVVKVPKKAKLADPGLRERFHRESRLLVQLQHPHIVRILDIGLHQNVPYIVMQYLSGGCLSDKMQGATPQQAAMPIVSVRGWLPEVAKALDFAHSRQVIHRDVKPANILFDDHGHAFLSDFGLTRIMHADPDADDAHATAAGMVVGTPNYVAPEIVLGHSYDGRADQYSLALTLYHALIGVPPMQGKSPSATMVNQTRRELPLLNQVRKTVPEAMALAVARAVSKNPGQRFATCLEFAEAVVDGLTRQPAPKPPSRGNANSTINALSDDTGEAAYTDSYSEYGEDEVSRPLPPRVRSREAGAQNTQRPKSASTSGDFHVAHCPSCRKELRLRSEHRGRRGRCIQCGIRLQISQDLKSLFQLPDSSASGSSSSSASDDLVLGEEVFGVRFSRRQILWLGIGLLVVVVVSSLAVWSFVNKPDEMKKKIDEVGDRERE